MCAQVEMLEGVYFYFTVSVWVFCLHVCPMCIQCDAVQKRVLGPLELELELGASMWVLGI